MMGASGDHIDKIMLGCDFFEYLSSNSYRYRKQKLSIGAILEGTPY